MNTQGELRRELKALRRDEGRTLLKLMNSPALRGALGVPEEGRLLEAFDGVVVSLGADLKSLALKNAYGIGHKDPKTLTYRRETFGALKEVDRGPDTVNNWEDEKIEELAARLFAGAALPRHKHHMIAVCVEAGVITLVTEADAEVSKPMRQVYNPNREPFLPCFIYTLPEYLEPERLTISMFFLDQVPDRVWAQACGDLLAWVCGDGRQELEITHGGIPGLDAAGWVSVTWEGLERGVWFGMAWGIPSCDGPHKPALD